MLRLRTGTRLSTCLLAACSWACSEAEPNLSTPKPPFVVGHQSPGNTANTYLDAAMNQDDEYNQLPDLGVSGDDAPQEQWDMNRAPDAHIMEAGLPDFSPIDARLDPPRLDAEIQDGDDWAPPEPPGLVSCFNPEDRQTACDWMATCLASQDCPSTNSAPEQESASLFCRQTFRSDEIQLLCGGVDCALFANATPLCQELSQ